MRTFIKKYNIQQFRKNCEAYILSFFRTQMRIKCFFTIFHTSLLSVRFSSIVISSCFQTLTLSSFRPLQQILNCLSLRFSQKNFFFLLPKRGHALRWSICTERTPQQNCWKTCRRKFNNDGAILSLIDLLADGPNSLKLRKATNDKVLKCLKSLRNDYWTG